jgi:hypothetical protein
MDPVWREDDFVWTPRVNGDMGHATLTLARPLVVDVPLDRVPLDSLFSVSVEVIASASNTRQRESYLGAYFRDPAGASGLDYEYSGLEPVDPPSRQPARASSQPGPVCSPGSGSAGTVQFAATEFGGAEPQRWGRVVVRRSGGDSGALAVRLTTGDGTATAGSDYTDASSWVLFADGEEGDRLVRVPFLDDAVEEPEETVTLSSRTQGAAPRSAPPPRRRSRSGTTMAPRPTTITRSAGPRVGLRGAASC